MKRLILTTSSGREEYSPSRLPDPAQMYTREGSTVSVTTQGEADAWGRALVAAFNDQAKTPRAFVSAVLEAIPEVDLLRAELEKKRDAAEACGRRAVLCDEQADRHRDRRRLLREEGAEIEDRLGAALRAQEKAS